MEIERRITDLEIKVTYQEELLDELNKIVAKQQDMIEFLLKENKQGSKPSPDQPTEGSLFEQLKNEKPPHY